LYFTAEFREPRETRRGYIELSRRSQEAKQNEIEYAIPFTHEVIVVADEDTPFQLLFKVIYTCGSSEYNKLRLLTIRQR